MPSENSEGRYYVKSRKTDFNAIDPSYIDFFELVTSTPFPIAFFDCEFRLLAASSRFIKAVGIEGKHLVGSNLKEFCQDAEFWEDKHVLAKTGVCIEGHEKEIWIPIYEEAQYVNWQIRPWYYSGGIVGGTVVSFQNVTEAVLSRKKLELSLEQEEKAKKIKSDFLSNISHELRTPLNGILGFTRLAMENHPEDTKKEYLKIVKESALKLLTIINDVLEFSATESNSISLELRKIPLCELVRQTVHKTSSAVHNKGLEMLVRFHDQKAVWIFVDPVRVKQVLVILLENATKFTHSGEIELSIKQFLPHDKKSKGKFRFSIRDTGIGIIQEKIQEIMQPFIQAEEPATKYYQGAGLGLAIAKNLLSMMNSKLRVNSNLGQGSCFWFDLELEFECLEVESVVDLGHLKRVLIIDDNQSARNNIEEILQFHNIVCDQAKDFSEALNLLKSGIFYDVVIRDHELTSPTETPVSLQLINASANSQLEIIVMHTVIPENVSLAVNDERPLKSIIQKPVRYQDLILALSALNRANQQPEFESETPILKNSEQLKESAMTILIVEDNLVNMILLRATLRKLFPKATLIEAGNGLVAVDICRQKLPDIIFMDIQMPVINGLEATRLIRQNEQNQEKKVPIIALTAGNEQGAHEKCMDAGMNFFLTKPYTSKDLLHAVEESLNR